MADETRLELRRGDFDKALALTERGLAAAPAESALA